MNKSYTKSCVYTNYKGEAESKTRTVGDSKHKTKINLGMYIT